MKVISIQTGKIKTYNWEGKEVKSAILKVPVQEPIFLSKVGLKTDQQAEEGSHGGIDKAIYSYASEYRELFAQETDRRIKGGSFGENLSTQGLLDSDVFPGDIYKVGEAIIQAVQPRIPCFKIGMRFNNPLMTMFFTKAGKYGVYYRVIQEGFIEPGCDMEIVQKSNAPISIEDLSIAYAYPKENLQLIETILKQTFLPLDLLESYQRFYNRYFKA